MGYAFFRGRGVAVLLGVVKFLNKYCFVIGQNEHHLSLSIKDLLIDINFHFKLFVLLSLHFLIKTDLIPAFFLSLYSEVKMWLFYFHLNLHVISLIYALMFYVLYKQQKIHHISALGGM